MTAHIPFLPKAGEIYRMKIDVGEDDMAEIRRKVSAVPWHSRHDLRKYGIL